MGTARQEGTRFPSCRAYFTLPGIPAFYFRGPEGHFRGKLRGTVRTRRAKERPPGAHYVDCYPCQPLLDVFAGEYPHGHDAQRRGERVGQRYRAVRQIVKGKIHACPQQQEHCRAHGQNLPRDMPDGQSCALFALVLCGMTALFARPRHIAVDGNNEVVDVDGEIGIDTFPKINPHRYRGHDYRGYPQTRVGVVFPP